MAERLLASATPLDHLTDWVRASPIHRCLTVVGSVDVDVVDGQLRSRYRIGARDVEPCLARGEHAVVSVLFHGQGPTLEQAADRVLAAISNHHSQETTT